MSAIGPNHLDSLLRDLGSQLRTYNTALDFSCHKRLGISMALFRIFKLVVNALGVLVAWGLVDMGADPTLGLITVLFIFGGSEVVETYLAESGIQDLTGGPSVPDGYEVTIEEVDDAENDS